MKAEKLIEIADLYGQSTLAGAGNGQSFFTKLVDATKEVPTGSLVALDLRKVELVSASFFRAGFRAYRDFLRSSPMLYLVFSNSNAATLEEVRFFAESTGDAYVFGKLNRRSEITSPFVVGKLDDKQAKTLASLLKLKEADAGQLFEAFPEPTVASSAAWSNRLAALAAKGLVVERLEGRLKKCRPLFEDLSYGA